MFILLGKYLGESSVYHYLLTSFYNCSYNCLTALSVWMTNNMSASPLVDNDGLLGYLSLFIDQETPGDMDQ